MFYCVCFSCVARVSELEHIQCVWHEYKETRKELEFLLSQYIFVYFQLCSQSLRA